ncbi:hypothetical protein ACSXAS_15520 (plasmid) [Clostridium perfringens]
MKMFLNKLIREIRKPIVLKDTEGVTQVYGGKSADEIEDELSEKLNRKVVVLPCYLSMYE